MSISALLTTETPTSPSLPHTRQPVQLTASSSRPQRRKQSMETPVVLPTLPPPKKRKRESENDEVYATLIHTNDRIERMGKSRESSSRVLKWIQ